MQDKVYVWDPLIRFFHWTLVLAFVIAYFSGEESDLVHIYSGYYILALIAVRVVWGFIGSRHARFSDFIYPLASVLGYLKDLLLPGKGKKYRGHNPAAAWMIFALLISLLLTGLSGLKLYGLEGEGPLAVNTTVISPVQHQAGLIRVSSEEHEQGDDDDDEEDGSEEFWEEIHEFFANFTVLLIFLHIGGVVVSSRKHGENLAKAMITGYKQS